MNMMILDIYAYENGMFGLNSFLYSTYVVVVDYEKEIFRVVKDRTEAYDEDRHIDLMFLDDYLSHKVEQERLNMRWRDGTESSEAS